MFRTMVKWMCIGMLIWGLGAVPAVSAETDSVQRITPDELNDRLETSDLTILDVRIGSTWTMSGTKIPGAVHVFPQKIQEWAADQPKDKPIAVYCD